jgi:inorganic triphosphatase YgiF
MKPMKPMKPVDPLHQPQEIELKLSLPGANPAHLLKQLSRTPILARRQPTQQQLHNIYYDTPGQQLRQQRMALRIRRIGSAAKPQWLQTLKTGNQGNSALSQRGEWETPVPNERLSAKALKATPWSGLDPDGNVFKSLIPCFSTRFERTIWLVRRRDGSVVEVALDIGQIVAADKTAPICELEFELKAGQPAALFEVAQQVAGCIAVLPANQSKAERGYALAQDALGAPVQAMPPKLTPNLPVLAAAQQVLGEMFCQFTSNLNALHSSEDPEVVHQARVGWRRFKSASRMFRAELATTAVPSWDALHALLTCLGELRDLEVALTDTLPPLAESYTAGSEPRTRIWEAMTQALEHDIEVQRKAVRYALRDPSLGACLLATTQWLAGLTALPDSVESASWQKRSLRHWSRWRIKRLHAQYKQAVRAATTLETQHRARILAKRLRYGIEALQSLLPAQRAKRWAHQATCLQSAVGATRDLAQARAFVARQDLDAGLVEFLRGVATGRAQPKVKRNI